MTCAKRAIRKWEWGHRGKSHGRAIREALLGEGASELVSKDPTEARSWSGTTGLKKKHPIMCGYHHTCTCWIWPWLVHAKWKCKLCCGSPWQAKNCLSWKVGRKWSSSVYHLSPNTQGRQRLQCCFDKKLAEHIFQEWQLAWVPWAESGMRELQFRPSPLLATAVYVHSCHFYSTLWWKSWTG